MKILLLSDETMSPNAGGLSQTLYNIFSFLSAKDILCITTEKSLKANPPGELFKDSYITYRFEIVNVPRNRFAKYVRPVVEWFNYNYNQYLRSFNSIKQQIKIFNPDVVVSCSNGPVGLFMHHKLLQGLDIKKVFPYFMDDWMNQKGFKWIEEKIYKWSKKLLSKNKSWLMISADLADILSERYLVKPDRFLVIHNPVDLSNVPDVLPVLQKSEYTLAYAGSLWPMHFDAFYVIAKAVKSLENKRKINLVLYTSKDFWNWRKSELEPLGVLYGGSIPYKDIHDKLRKADALIVTSSFSEEWYTHSKGSVQTKITDYLKAKRLVISCGPAYSANHNFIKQHHCGVCIETNDVEKVADQLFNILNNISSYQPLVENGWRLLQEEFSFTKVHHKLSQYLLQAS